MPPSRKPHIVFIVLDTHRYDRLGAYGCTRGLTPNLDAFAGSATLFEHAVSPAQWTIPSHASMFSGEFPTTHLTTQSGDMLDPAFRTLAVWLRCSGYDTTGYCNNPLVGVIDNGLTRGFNTFYNYGGAVPTTPASDLRRSLRLLSQVWERYTQLLRKISYPVQNMVARSERVFRFTLNPALVPLWTRFANFKGDTPRSAADTTRFVQQKIGPGQKQPQFLFANFMETHLPFSAPEPFFSRFAPTVKAERAAQDFLRVYNTQALRWLMPMETPFSALEAQTLNEMYDVEAAYQDHLLGRLLETLDQPYHRENTVVVIAADHGEMLGEHQLMSHGFGVYEELVRVPLMIRFPGQQQGERVSARVSTVQIFHTLLEAAGLDGREVEEHLAAPLEKFSLRRTSPPRTLPLVVSEAYPPQNVIRILEKENPGLLERFHCRSVYRAAYNQSAEKLIQVEPGPTALYRLDQDPREEHDLGAALNDAQRHPLQVGLDLFKDYALDRRPQTWTRRDVRIEDPRVLQRLKDLGYID